MHPTTVHPKTRGTRHHHRRRQGRPGADRVQRGLRLRPGDHGQLEFYDNMTPEKAKQLVDDLRAGNPPAPTRGPSRLCTWKEASRVLAGFGDGLAGEARRPVRPAWSGEDRPGERLDGAAAR